jgi:predicted Zn-dependent protease
MVSQVPRIAQRAERLVLRVLFVAAHSDDAAQDDEIRKAASAIRREPQDLPIEIGIAFNDARLLNEAARVAFWRRGSVQEALSLQTQAFGANPLDPEVVSNLAFLHLKQRPRQADSARQLALYALTMHDPRYPEGRIEDWNTLAIASALMGRDRDARNAWFVTLALAPNLEQQCKVAIRAYSTYGEPLRSPVEAMLYRVYSSGRSARSPLCEWPPSWTATSRTR